MALREAGVKLIADGAAGFKSDMEGATKAVGIFGEEGGKSTGLIGGLAGVLGNVAKIAAGITVAGFMALSGALGFAVNEAIQAEQATAQLEAVLESTGGAAGVTSEMANDLATSLSGVTRFGDEAIIAGESMLLTFTNIGSDVFPRATETMLDMSQAMGQDLKASAIQLGKALNDPVDGMSALSRVGVTFTDEQKKMVEQMVKVGDIAGAQAVILDELEKEFGGSAKAAGETFAGQLDILKNTMGNLAETIGFVLLPYLTSFLSVISTVAGYLLGVAQGGDVMSTALEGIPEPLRGAAAALGELVQGFMGFTAEIGPAMGELGKWLVGMLPGAIRTLSTIWNSLLLPSLKGVGTTLQTYVLPFLGQAATFLQNVLGAALQFVIDHWEGFKGALIAVGAVLAGAGIITAIMGVAAAIGGLLNPVTLVIGAVALLGMAWTENWGGIRDVLTEIWTNTLQPALAELWSWLQVVIPIALQMLSEFWTGTLLPAIQTVWAWITTTLLPLLADVAAWLITNLPIALQTWADFWTGTLLPAILSVWSWIETNLLPLFATVQAWLAANLPTALSTLSEFWTGTLLPAIQGVWAWIEGTLLPLFQTVLEWLGTTLTNALTTLGDFWTNTLLPAMEGVWSWTETNLVPLFEAIAELFNVGLTLALTALAGLWENVLLPALTGVWSFISDSLKPIFEDIKAYLEGDFSDALNGLVNGAIGALKGAFEGISGAIQSVIGWVESMTSALSNVTLPPWLTPGSPTPFEIGLLGIADALSVVTRDARRFDNALDFGGDRLVGIGLDVTRSGLREMFETQPIEPVASPTQIMNVSNQRNVNVSFVGNYSSTPQIQDESDLAYALGTAGGL